MYVGLYAICVWNWNWWLTQDHFLIKHWSQRTHRYSAVRCWPWGVFIGAGQPLQHGEVRDTNLAWVRPVDESICTESPEKLWFQKDERCTESLECWQRPWTFASWQTSVFNVHITPHTLTNRGRDKMAAILQTVPSSSFFYMTFLKFVAKGPIDNNPALVKIMAWRRPGDKPLSEPMMVIFLTYICITRPQWIELFLVNHSDVVGASPVSATPTTSSFPI